VSLRDKDLASVQAALRGLEDDRKKLGDEHTSDRFSLELEIERVKRDLEQCEDELDRAKADLHDRDVEYGQLVRRFGRRWVRIVAVLQAVLMQHSLSVRESSNRSSRARGKAGSTCRTSLTRLQR
jgi:septal ring factor EnvC (AmiA/AmiB activator)